MKINEKNKTLEKLDNRDILLGHEARDERRGKKKCRRRQCLETRNFNLHTAHEKVAVHGYELHSAVVIEHQFYNVSAMEVAGLVVFLPHYSSLSKHKQAIRPLPRLVAEKFSDLRHGSARKTRS